MLFTDFIILSNVVTQQIERCETRMIQTKKMLAISHPVLLISIYRQSWREPRFSAGSTFDQLSEPLQELLRIEIAGKDKGAYNAMRMSAIMRLEEIKQQIKILRSGCDRSSVWVPLWGTHFLYLIAIRFYKSVLSSL